MAFFRYFVNRYEKENASIYKMVIVLSTVAICIPIYARYNIKFYVGGCAKDALFAMMERISFFLLELICVFIFIRLSSKDSNQNIVVRYAGKRRIWTYQSIAAFIYSMECMLLIHFTAIITGYIFFGAYDKWHLEGSCFYTMAMKRKYPLELPLSEFEMYFLILSLKIIIMSIIHNIALVLDYMSNGKRIVVLVTVVICALDYLGVGGVRNRFDIYFYDLYSINSCIQKLVSAALITVVLFLVGLYISKYREYYNKQEHTQ